MFEPELRRLETFEDLSARELRRLIDLFEELALPAGDVVFRQGAPADGFYVIQEGSVELFRASDDDEPVQLLAHLGPGQHFGDFGIYDDQVCAASAHTAASSHVLRLGPRAMMVLLAEHPTVALNLHTASGRRLAGSVKLGRRREVRTLVGHQVGLLLEDGTSTRARVVDLSRGGVCLADAESSWRVGDRVRFHLGLGTGMLQLGGDIAWRGVDAMGITFTQRSQGHNMKIQWALRQLVGARLRPHST